LFLALSASVGALFSPIDSFGKIQLIAWAVFGHAALFLALAAIIIRVKHKLFALGCIVTAGAILLIALDAFLIEPRWLEVTRLSLPAPGLTQPVRVVVIADLQTDNPGDYEEMALRLAMQAKPDLILMPGDYIHLRDPQRYRDASAELNEMIRRVGLSAPLGVYAVGGNVDRDGLWRDIFSNSPVTVFDGQSPLSLDAGPLVITGLSLYDSIDTEISIPAAAKYHIVLGHNPNFSLGDIEADLLVAGHTHGGQVRLPFIGPLLTLTDVPRSWAAGVTTIQPGKTLIVSRGIGMERHNAPRLRFLCRPELIVVDLIPMPK
jgi:hypothetical protein